MRGAAVVTGRGVAVVAVACCCGRGVADIIADVGRYRAHGVADILADVNRYLTRFVGRGVVNILADVGSLPRPRRRPFLVSELAELLSELYVHEPVAIRIAVLCVVRVALAQL